LYYAFRFFFSSQCRFMYYIETEIIQDWFLEAQSIFEEQWFLNVRKLKSCEIINRNLWVMLKRKQNTMIMTNDFNSSRLEQHLWNWTSDSWKTFKTMSLMLFNWSASTKFDINLLLISSDSMLITFDCLIMNIQFQKLKQSDSWLESLSFYKKSVQSLFFH